MANLFTPFLAGFALSAVLIVAIGAQNLFVLRQGLMRRHVGPIVLFCGLADALLIAMGVGGGGVVLAAVPELTRGLAIGGALFLGFYGLKVLRRLATPNAMVVGEARGLTLARALTAVVGLTFLNPHVYLDTVVLMGAAGSAQPAALRPVFAFGAASASFTWFSALGYGARFLAPLFARPSAWRVLDALVGLTMLALAASFVASAVHSAQSATAQGSGTRR